MIKVDAGEFVKSKYRVGADGFPNYPDGTDAQEGLNILIKHFLGDDWYVVDPLPNCQVNTLAIYEILQKYPKKQSLFKRVKRFFIQFFSKKIIRRFL